MFRFFFLYAFVSSVLGDFGGFCVLHCNGGHLNVILMNKYKNKSLDASTCAMNLQFVILNAL